MNIRVVTFLSSDNEQEIKDIVADFCESLVKKGFANNIEDTTAQLKSVIVVKENDEVMEIGADIFFAEQMSGSLLTVIPTEELKENEEIISINPEDDGA